MQKSPQRIEDRADYASLVTKEDSSRSPTWSVMVILFSRSVRFEFQIGFSFPIMR